MFILDDKTYFWLFWALPMVVFIFVMTRLWRKRAQQKFADSDSLKRLSPDKSRFKPLLKLVFFLLALSCFILALINPKIGGKMETVKRRGVDIVFAVDVSKSMLAEDIAPNRLEKSKRIVQKIIDNLHGDRVGIIAYAGSAFPQLPITTDYAAAKMFLSDLNTDMVSSQGTAIAQAIDLSQEYFNDDSKTSRVLVLITDGEDHGGDIEQISKEAAQKNIRIFTIGIGTDRGGRIPIKENGRVVNFKKDRQGETVITKRDKHTLQEIAKVTQGEYIDGKNTQKVVDKVEDFLGTLQKSEFKTKRFASFKAQFQWFLAFGILFTVLDILLLERKTTWLKRLNLFNENREEDEN